MAAAMTGSTRRIQLTDEDVKVVLQAISEGRVRTLDDVPYDPKEWDEETVRDWLERTHMPTHARWMVSTLRGGRKIKSRPVAPTVRLALGALEQRIQQLELEVADLRERLSRASTAV